ncbi:MAG: hypothetical protein VKJ24_12505 [Synechococcales bacterium]|nr:hypothetical protein [Synechococcales bacterium]
MSSHKPIRNFTMDINCLNSPASDQIPSRPQSNTIVLQPYALSGADGTSFRASLEEALSHAEAIVIDLLWMDGLTSDDLSVLLMALQRANQENKVLSFLSMDVMARRNIEQLQEKNREGEMGNRYSVFTPDFERFLENHQSCAYIPYCVSLF